MSSLPVQRKLSSVNSEDVSATSLRVSLLCPVSLVLGASSDTSRLDLPSLAVLLAQLGKVQMTTPVRGTYCDHLQCFDASVYLQMNERCVVCCVCVCVCMHACVCVMCVCVYVLSLSQTSDMVLCGV